MAVLLAVYVSTAVAAARSAEPDGPAGRAAISKEACAALQAGKYAQLEQTADELRKTKARLPEGVWKLPFFYAGLDPTYDGGNSPGWQDSFAKFDAWKEAFPNSLVQPVAWAAALVSYGWEARGSGFANTVTPEGWKLLGDRLQEAHRVLEEAAKQPERDPQWYLVMQRVALGEGWSRERYDALFGQAVAAEPTYYNYYFDRVMAEMPRWGGEPDSWINFAEEAARKDDPAEGLSIYTRIIWSHQGFAGGGFQNPKLSWPKFRQGFRDIEKRYPNSNWNLNSFCRFACLAGDRETACELFTRLGSSSDLVVWETQQGFEDWRRWAQSEQGTAQLRANLAVATDERLTVGSIAFSPDGKTLLAGYDDGKVRLWDLASRKVTWSGGLSRREIAAVTFSPDGRWFAVGSGDQRDHAPGAVRLWNAQTRMPMTVVQRSGSVFGLAFTPDSKTLAIAGGNYANQGTKNHGEIALYELATEKLDVLPWDTDYVLTAVAISSDGEFLVTPKGNSMNCWSLTEQKFVTDYHTHIVHGNTVRAVAISPDGKTLVTGVAPGWTDRKNPGEMRRWNMGATGWPEIKIPAWEALPVGILALSFSPNGKWLAAGGYDGSVRLWDVATGKIAATLIGHQQPIICLAFAPDSKTLASGSSDATIKWWNVPASGAP